MSGPTTKAQAETAVPIATRFMAACSDQIRLAPDKCMRIRDSNLLFCLIDCSYRNDVTLGNCRPKLLLRTDFETLLLT